MSLARLLEQATPGPWGDRLVPPFSQSPGERAYMNKSDVALIALAPDMARLLIDAVKWIEKEIGADGCKDPDCQCSAGRAADLRARFAELEQQAAR